MLLKELTCYPAPTHCTRSHLTVTISMLMSVLSQSGCCSLHALAQSRSYISTNVTAAVCAVVANFEQALTPFDAPNVPDLLLLLVRQ